MSEWLKDSFIFYQRHFVGLLSIVVPVAILQEFILTQWVYDEIIIDTEFQMQQLLLPVVLLAMTIKIVIGSFLQVYVIYYIQAVLNGQLSNFKSIVGKPLAVLPYFIMLDILISVAMFFGLLIFIIPGIYIFIKLLLAQYFYLLGNKGLLESIKASWQATKGYGWDLLLGFIIIFVISFVPALLTSNEPELINSILNIVSTCLGLVMTIFLYRAYDYIQENPRVID